MTFAQAIIRIALAGDVAIDAEPRLRRTDEVVARDAARQLAALTGVNAGTVLERERTATQRIVSALWPRIVALADSLRLSGDELIGPDLDAALAAAARGDAWQRGRRADAVLWALVRLGATNVWRERMARLAARMPGHS